MKRVLIVPAIALAGCGGGGGSSDLTAMDLSSAPGQPALDAHLQGNYQTSLSATDAQANSYSLQINEVANPGTTTFNGQSPAYSRTRTVTLDKNAVLVATSVETGYYLLNPYTPLGTVFNAGTPYSIPTAFTALPATITVGSSGPFIDEIIYHDSTMAVVDADVTETYSVQSLSPTALLLCLNSVTSNVTAQGTTDGLANDTETDCYSDSAAGTVDLYSITVSVNGVTLTFK